MLRRRGNWRAVLCVGRPHLLQDAKTADPSLKLGSKATAVGLPSPSIAAAVSCASPSSNVLQLRSASLTPAPPVTWAAAESQATQQGVLRHALASRDAFCVFRALLRAEQQRKSSSAFSGESELDRLLQSPEREAKHIATVLCACVAVTLNPADWPPWVSARFSTAGVASMLRTATPAPSSSSSTTASEQRRSREHNSSSAETKTAASALHAPAVHVLRRVAHLLPRQQAGGGSTSPRLSLLRWLALLCGVCLAPSTNAALRLAGEVGNVSLDAAGVALAAFCAAQTSQGPGECTAAQEQLWLLLWMQLTHPSIRPPSPPPFALSTAVLSGAALSWSDGLCPAKLRETRVSWHLHCLLAVKDANHAARLLAGTCADTEKADSRDSGVLLAERATAAHDGDCILPIKASTQAELLSLLPAELLEEDGIGERLSFSLLAGLKRRRRESTRLWNGVPHALSFVPAVVAHSILYARMLRYVLASTVQVQSAVGYVQHLHDLALLLSSASVYALAASLVPSDQPLTAVMVAARDAHREEHMQLLVSAVREVMEALCEEPTPLPTAHLASLPCTLGTGAPLASSSFSGAGKRKRKPSRAEATLQRLQYASTSPGAFSWRWREDVMGDVDGAVKAAVRLITSLLELCSSRKSSLPLRGAEPKWRRELRQRTAVRAHKYELLLQELPHTELQAMLHTLLRHGYTREGSQLGLSLLKGDQVDLHYYTLPLLGSLYLAVSVSSAAPSSSSVASTAAAQEAALRSGDESVNGEQTDALKWKEAVYGIYRRRFEVFGDADLNVTPPSFSSAVAQIGTAGALSGERPSASMRMAPSTSSPTAATPANVATTVTTSALVCAPESPLVQALVLASAPLPHSATSAKATAELANCLLNRRVTVAGHGVVVDVGARRVFSPHRDGVVFGSWIRKGSATL